MGNYCSLIHESWGKVLEPMRGEIMKYMKEHFIFPYEENEKYERFVLMSIGSKWRNHKHELRKLIYKLVATEPLSKIIFAVPKGVASSQWVHLVNDALSSKGIHQRRKNIIGANKSMYTGVEIKALSNKELSWKKYMVVQ